MNKQHPITPPTELVREWQANGPISPQKFFDYFATQAARWGWEQRGSVNDEELQKGRDEELDACCEWLRNNGIFETRIGHLRAARRPKPPTLKEQAQRILVENGTTLDGRMELESEDIEILRSALELLPDEEV